MMLGIECLRDLNFIMNHLNKVGYQYKSNAHDFKAEGENGIVSFLNWEELERYKYADKVADYIANNHGKITYVMIPEPIQKGATIESLSDLVSFEKQTVEVLDSFIKSAGDRGSELTKSFFIQLRHMCQHQYNEVNGVVSDIKKILNDPGAMISYNIFLKNEFKVDEY